MAHPRSSARRHRLLGGVVALVVWLAFGAGGLALLAAHGAVAGRPAAAPQELPMEAELSSALRQAGRATLVMVAHPACPCTRASVRELERLLGAVPLAKQAGGEVEVVVLFAGPRRGEANRDRVAGELRSLAGAIPGARIVDDRDGIEASRLGAHTSGTILFYDRAGRLRFNGGITPGRGHEGDSAGADALRALLEGATTAGGADGFMTKAASPVFGCELADRGRQP
jgi:hypothetical protein